MTEPEKRLASAEELKGRRGAGEQRPGRGRRGLGVLLALLALAAAAGIYAFSLRPGESPAAQETAAPAAAGNERVALISRKREEVAGVTVTRADESYTVVPGEKLTLKDQPAFDLDQGKGAALIGCAAGLTADRLAAEKAEDLKEYGLDAPVSRVTMTWTDGTEQTWLLGGRAPAASGSYLMEEKGGRIYLIGASAAEAMGRSRNEMHTLRMPGPLEAGRIREMVIEAEGRDPVEVGYSREGEADREFAISALRIRQPFYHTASAERVGELFAGAAGLTVTAYAGELEALSDTGLTEEGGRYRLTIRQARTAEDPTNLETFVIRVGQRTAEGDQVYLGVDGTRAVYLAPAASTEFLEHATPAYLVDSFANLISIGAVNRVEILAGEEEWTLEIAHGKEKTDPDVYRFNGREIQDASSFRKLYQQIVGMTSSRISEDYQMEGEPLVTVRYVLDVAPWELTTEYLDTDADYCAMRRDGLTLFLIKREQVEGLLQALRAFAEADR